MEQSERLELEATVDHALGNVNGALERRFPKHGSSGAQVAPDLSTAIRETLERLNVIRNPSPGRGQRTSDEDTVIDVPSAGLLKQSFGIFAQWTSVIVLTVWPRSLLSPGAVEESLVRVSALIFGIF